MRALLKRVGDGHAKPVAGISCVESVSFAPLSLLSDGRTGTAGRGAPPRTLPGQNQRTRRELSIVRSSEGHETNALMPFLAEAMSGIVGP